MSMPIIDKKIWDQFQAFLAFQVTVNISKSTEGQDHGFGGATSSTTNQSLGSAEDMGKDSGDTLQACIRSATVGRSSDPDETRKDRPAKACSSSPEPLHWLT
ncbi:unnamed protein product [Rhizoctonia solani]|uniref:Uncharacterized protein n=1 Tax=Rhizoctonia solani TaxID=456999 RepID=A0A8H3A1J8_9AGAM|nr:unnamed protein product [Rhizoctonia solani]